MIDFTVRTGNPTALDATVQSMVGCAAAVVADTWNGETCVVRVLVGADFFKFACESQGYCEIVGEAPSL